MVSLCWTIILVDLILMIISRLFLRNSVLFFNVVHFNTCSLACRYNELIVMSEKYYFDAIAVSETWLTKR